MVKVTDDAVKKAVLAVKRYCDEHPDCEGCAINKDGLCVISFLDPCEWDEKDITGGK